MALEELKEMVKKTLDSANFHKSEALLLEEELLSVKDVLDEEEDSPPAKKLAVTATVKPNGKNAKAVVLELLQQGEQEAAELAAGLIGRGYKTDSEEELIDLVLSKCLAPLVSEGKVLESKTKPKRYKLS